MPAPPTPPPQSTTPPPAEPAFVAIDPAASPRVEYAAERLAEAIRRHASRPCTIVRAAETVRGHPVVVVGTAESPDVRRLFDTLGGRGAPAIPAQNEGFFIRALPEAVLVVGHDDSGALYGCLELARRIGAEKRLPQHLDFADAPAFTLRGPAFGMQKPHILPGRKVYEYPYTPELFPFFYDDGYWDAWLDYLVDQRFNTLFIWNGHPFASLVKVDEYPEALEVPPAVFERNVEQFRRIARECDRRGIWLVQSFYSILISQPLAERHGLPTQLSAIHPLAADYTRKSIAAFVKAYPNVGLMPCLGEALQKLDEQVKWCCEVILPGVKDGMAAAGLAAEPPVVIRTHATDARVVMPAALKVYRNLYTEAKYNGESLTTSEPRGVRQALHRAMADLGSTHLINVHILANLEPFRYAAQRFIRKCVVAARDRFGARGLHLYPLAFWDWPHAPDAAEPPLKQWERDWPWFEAWARYTWNPDIPEADDRAHWLGRFGETYGCDAATAQRILDACNDFGECAPRLLRRFGITEGNRQTLSLGMTLDQLVNPDTYRPFPELWESQSPPGERLGEYAERAWHGRPHEGETPPQIVQEVLDFSARAAEAIAAAQAGVTRHREEFDRLANDVACIRAMSQCYAEKVRAAMAVLRYRFSEDVADMRTAAEHLAASLEHYRTLARLTERTYRYANSMQTNQRKIPVSGGIDGKAVSYHWSQLLGLYETELVEFRRRVEAIESGRAEEDESSVKPLPRANFRVISPGVERFEVGVGAGMFTDRKWVIESLAPELQNLMSFRFAHAPAAEGKYQGVEFELDEPACVLIGYAKGESPPWLRAPNLETDAYADDRGGAEPVIVNAAAITAMPPVDVHALRYPAGRQKLEVRGAGSFVVLGVVPAETPIRRRDAGRGGGSRP